MHRRLRLLTKVSFVFFWGKLALQFLFTSSHRELSY